MNCLAVIDTNVLVSALLSGRDDAATVQVVERVLSGSIIPLYSGPILAEYREVLHRRKFGFSAELAEHLISAVEKFGISVDPGSRQFSLPDVKDLPFYAVVMEKRDEGAYLVTGNLKHFPKEPFIVTPRELLEVLNGGADDGPASGL